MIDSNPSSPGAELATIQGENLPHAPPPPIGDPSKVRGRRRRFVDYYLVNLNGAKSAELAGYAGGKSARTQAARLLADEDVMAAISVGMTERAKRTEVTQDRVVRELARIAFADLRGLVRWGTYDRPPKEGAEPATENPEKSDTPEDDEGSEVRIAGETLDVVNLVPSDQIDPDDAAAVAEVGAGPNGLRIKLHDKQKALELLGRHLGMWTDPQAGGQGNTPIPVAINIALVTSTTEKP